MRRKIDDVLPEGLGVTIDLLGQIRPLVMERIQEETARKEILERMFLHCLEKAGKASLEELTEFLTSHCAAEENGKDALPGMISAEERNTE